MTSEKKAVDLGLLEEDDEFEEFPTDGMKTKGFLSLLDSCLILISEF